jgi:hypothetical protein
MTAIPRCKVRYFTAGGMTSRKDFINSPGSGMGG